MSRIKTNYRADSKLVLVNNENKIVAVINCLKESDIANQVKLAIKEELGAKEVAFEEDIIFDPFQIERVIPFFYFDEDEEKFYSVFTLVKTAEY